MGLYAPDPRGADVAQRGHVAAPCELTQTHASSHMAQWINRAKSIGPTGIVGLRVKLRGGRTDNIHIQLEFLSYLTNIHAYLM